MRSEKRSSLHAKAREPGLLDWPRLFSAAEEAGCLRSLYGVARHHEEGRFWLNRRHRLEELGSRWSGIRETVDQAAFLIAMEGLWAHPAEALPVFHRPPRSLWAAARILEESVDGEGREVFARVRSRLARFALGTHGELGGQPLAKTVIARAEAGEG